MSLSTDYVVNTSSLLMAPLFRRKCFGLMLISSTQRREKGLAMPSKPHQASPMRGLRREFRHVINPRLTPTSQLVYQLLRVRACVHIYLCPRACPKISSNIPNSSSASKRSTKIGLQFSTRVSALWQVMALLLLLRAGRVMAILRRGEAISRYE